MNVIEFFVFCIGISTVSFATGVVASALGCKFGKYLVKRGNNMEKTYTYCERCGKPVEPKNNNHYDICGNCAAILLKRYLMKRRNRRLKTLFLDTVHSEIRLTVNCQNPYFKPFTRH